MVGQAVNETTQRVATSLAIHNEELSDRADVASEKIDLTVTSAWDQILAIIKKSPDRDYNTTRRDAQHILNQLANQLIAHGEDILVDAVDFGYKSTFKIFDDHVPKAFWETATKESVLEQENVESHPIYQQPNRQEARAIINKGFRGQNWKSRMNKWSTKITDHDKVAELIAQGAANGEDIDKTAKKVAKYVGNLGASARRIVRTEYHRVANKAQEKVYSQFGDAIVGYQIVAVRDERTRPSHRHRSGTIFWKPRTNKRPSTNQKPELPDAPNCRCSYVPVFADQASTRKLPNAPVIDPVTFNTWFDQQPEEKQIKIVGRDRHEAMRSKLKRDPRYFDFVNPETGQLLSASDIEDESMKSQRSRVRKLEKVMKDRRTEIAKAYTSPTPTPVGRIGVGADVAMLQSVLVDEQQRLRDLRTLQSQLQATRHEQAAIDNVVKQAKATARKVTTIKKKILMARG